MKYWVIIDWTGKVCFHNRQFQSYEDADKFLLRVLGDNYDVLRGEYYIEGPSL